MPDFQLTVTSLVGTLVSAADELAKRTDGWQVGLDAHYSHSLNTTESGKVSVGIAPAVPFPINVSLEGDASRAVADTTNLRFWASGWGQRATQPALPGDVNPNPAPPVPVPPGVGAPS